MNRLYEAHRDKDAVIINKPLSSFACVIILILLAAALAQSAAVGPAIPREEAQAIAQEAYVYLYPLILMDITRKQLTNLDPKTSHFGGPANTFTHIRAFPTQRTGLSFALTSTPCIQAPGSI